ncbi:hypothetical protein J5N97_003611 [Dioscorea zingiberensis]|uniref:VQ domain-containing protein n=1 Tax=Dioscorea zingiberensis TaxID=325984 RepID=A0A9D5D707_9LILI|nr:hypothetical protein J5N97_003611 [Dioscorea zingiberensis]
MQQQQQQQPENKKREPPNKAKKKPLKVVYISSPLKVKVNASKFRDVVQELTGRDSNVAHMSKLQEFDAVQTHQYSTVPFGMFDQCEMSLTGPPDEGLQKIRGLQGLWMRRDIELDPRPGTIALLLASDNVVQILKTIRDLVFLDGKDNLHTDEMRAGVAHTPSRQLPSIIKYNIGSCRHNILVALKQGQRPLLWIVKEK